MPSSKLSDLATRILPIPQELRDAPGVHTGVKPDPAVLSAFRIGRPLPAGLHDDGGLPRTGAAAAAREAGAAAQAFGLTITAERIGIAADGDAGRLYAVQALRQLLVAAEDADRDSDHESASGVTLPCGSVEDWPDLPDRGYMLDISRNRVPTRETLDELLDLLLLLRYNHLELYLEHTFAYAQHQEVWEGWSPMTPEEVRRLDREAAARGIELVPNQNSFGHMTRWLEHESYRHLAETPDGFTDPWGGHRDYPFSLAPVAAGVEEFLAGLYDELLPCFRSRRFHVGLDETFDLGQGRSAEAIAAEAERLGAAASADAESARGRIYLDFLKRIHAMVDARNHRMLFWADIIQNHPDLVPELPEGVPAVEWGYDADHDFDTRCRRLADAGVEFMVAPGTSLWNSVGGRYNVAKVNIRRAVDAALRFGGRGMLLTDWGDNGHIPPPVLADPAIALAGAHSWNAAAALPDGPAPSPESSAFGWVRRFVLADALGRDREDAETSAQLSEALRLLNTLDRHNPTDIPNASILGVALFSFDNPNHSRFMDTLPPEPAAGVRHDLLRIREHLAAAVPRTERGRRHREELLFAVDLGDYALQLLSAHRHRRGSAVMEAEEAAQVHEAVRRGYGDLSARLTTLWTRRSRPGGLERSLGELAKAANALGILGDEDIRAAGAGAPSSAV